MRGSALAEACRSHLPAILTLGSPFAAAGIHTAIVLGVMYFQPPKVVGGNFLFPFNALLATAGSALGGFLVKDDFAVRLVYALGAAVCSFLVFCVLSCLGFFGLAAFLGTIVGLKTA